MDQFSSCIFLPAMGCIHIISITGLRYPVTFANLLENITKPFLDTLESITMIIPHCLHLPEAVRVQALFLFVYYSVNLHLSALHILVHVQTLSPALVKVLWFVKFFSEI